MLNDKILNVYLPTNHNIFYYLQGELEKVKKKKRGNTGQNCWLAVIYPHTYILI